MIHTFSEKQDCQLYIRSMGKRLKITAMASSDDEANAYMETHDHAAVIAEFSGFVFMADKWDKGTDW